MLRDPSFPRKAKTYDKPLIGKRGILILDGGLLIAGFLAPFLSKMLLALPFDCWIQSIGYLCPACGGTRAVVLLFRGRILDAFSMNPYFMITGCVLLIGWSLLHISCFWNNAIVRKWCRGLFHPYVAILWAMGFLLFGILRNVY